ncbi:hypothetical protein [Paenarthrobacter nicotinovorans]|uniref:hypothetical protein n=1 Tax=Paenarthrobacter nicotinovorans TaxID=29320 RepID=UPI0011A05690|nr:hypothetical protein [Paenarthrobacter nicotinovorans]
MADIPAPAVIEALADSGWLVLGLDIRDYQGDGTFLEVLWSTEVPMWKKPAPLHYPYSAAEISLATGS